MKASVDIFTTQRDKAKTENMHNCSVSVVRLINMCNILQQYPHIFELLKHSIIRTFMHYS